MTRAEALRILGLQTDSTPSEIKQAYRQLVKAVHPDKNSASNARHLFQLVQEAYEFITVTGDQAKATRDRAEREARARAARTSAAGRTKQEQESAGAEKKAREQADREQRDRETGRKSAKEEDAEREWEGQRAAAVAGLGFLGHIAAYVVFTLTIVWFLSPVLNFSLDSVVVALVVAFPLISALVSMVDKLKKKYQLIRFDKSHPPPTNTARDRQRSTAVTGLGAGLTLGAGIVLYFVFCTVITAVWILCGLEVSSDDRWIRIVLSVLLVSMLLVKVNNWIKKQNTYGSI